MNNIDRTHSWFDAIAHGSSQHIETHTQVCDALLWDRELIELGVASGHHLEKATSLSV